MRQEEERFRSFDRGVDINPPRGWNLIDSLGVRGSVEFSSSRERRLWEICLRLQKKDNKERGEKESSLKTDSGKADGFEPFLNQEFKEEDLFVNNYGGNFSQKMELNRGGVERALKIAHLNGKVFLTNLQPNRSRAEAQGNELAAKRFLFFGERTQKVEEENPLKRVISIPEGWRIEVNDRRITEELTERGLAGKKLQKAFTRKFNGLVKEGIQECVWKEKCSSEKDRYFRWKLLRVGIHQTLPFIVFAPFLITETSLTVFLFLIFGSPSVGYGVGNFLGELQTRQRRSFENILKEMNPNYRPCGFSASRNIDHAWEYFMPFVEIDKVARTFAYLMPVIGKGRTIVKPSSRLSGGKVDFMGR